MQRYGIFDKDGKLDCDPEPMVFDTRKEAVEMLNSDAYDSADGFTVGEVVYDRCAKCGGIITDHEVSVTLSSGKKICQACIWEAMKDKYGQEGKP